MSPGSIILRLREFPLRRLSRAAFRVAAQSQKLFRNLGAQPQSRIRWDEFRNKLEAFLAFDFADLLVGAQPEASLHQLIARAEISEPELSAFAIEGIGYHLTKSELRQKGLYEGARILSDLAESPDRSLVPLHAGSGLALAECWLGRIDKNRFNHEPLQEFIAACGWNSLPDYGGIAHEALGFVTQTLYPHMIGSIDDSLSPSHGCLAYFWHGVGRGSYFAPANASPFRSAPWTAVELCVSGTPHRLARQNALAGLAWALTVINLGQPEIMACFLKHHVSDLTEEPAFMHGVRSAAVICKGARPEDPRLERFPRYMPTYAEFISREVWNCLVERPFMEALRDGTSLEAKPEELFRYSPSQYLGKKHTL